MRYLAILATTLSLLLAGCATTIRSDVTAFHQWPAALQDKSYVFEAAAPPDDTLEYRSYLDLVRAELSGLGFVEARNAAAAKLKVSMRFTTTDHPLRVIEEIDPYWARPGYWSGGYYREPWPISRWSGPGFGPYYGPFYGPYYDPFMYGYSPFGMREAIRHVYERQLRIAISATDGKKLFDVTVHNTSSKAATPAVMPALVASAFSDFPGPNGVPRQVALKLK
jgi:hypothetical protein